MSHKKPRKNCLWCGDLCKSAVAKYCSRTCKGAHHTEMNIQKRNLRKVCLTCNNEFIARTNMPNQIFCSSRCFGLSRTEEVRQLGYANRGKTRSPKTKSLLSLKALEHAKTRSSPVLGQGGCREDIGHFVRSRWEANIARILNFEKIQYSFEKKSFPLKLSDGTILHYLPDFELHNRFIEVKGWWSPRALLKKKLMEEQYPDIKIEYISSSEYYSLEKYYSKIIDEWESKI